ncbi:hypothetical protein [Nocardioides sp.]|uniref:hypothetical protein n=1 Tax=Nocardioides sp. TaxID=35761 RepID=UPI003563E47F
MRGANHENFETFYKDVRDELLLQTYALTGDLHASEKAVRDAFVVSWHHWRKVSRLEDPREYVRPLAWSRALRRSQARWWSRMKGLDPEVGATLDCLAKLPLPQRRVLLLSTLTNQPLDAIAREAGLTRAAAERDLQSATAQFTLQREVDPTRIRPTIEDVSPTPGTVRWPRPSIITRAGSARRRSHTTFGVVTAVATLVVAGSLVTDTATGARPSLQTKGVLEAAAPNNGPTRPNLEGSPLLPDHLVTADQVGVALRGQWNQGPTTNNTIGNGLNFTCQGARFADPEGLAAQVRTFAEDGGEAKAGQSVEVSADEKSGKATYRTTRGWYAGCLSPRVQLLATRKVVGIGDQAMMFVLRDWNDPTSTQVVGVARTGTMTTTMSTTKPGRRMPRQGPAARLLADAVEAICELPGGAACVQQPKLETTTPVPVGLAPAMLSVVDLPPVTRVAQPWVGTEPKRAQTNLAATRCEEADFSTKQFSRSRTRSFLIPGADLPPEFGLTQTIGALRPKAATEFIETVRTKLESCKDRDLGTNVTQVHDETNGNRALTVWRLSVEVSEDRTVTYLMGIIRNGTAVSQLTFIPSGRVVMGSEAFISLAMRAQERLLRLGKPKP